MFRRPLSFFARLALFATCLPLPAHAHDIPLHTVVNAFVKMEPHQADVVIRVPLDILHSAQFPMKAQVYDLSASGPAIDLALRGVVQGLDLRENGVPLVSTSVVGRLDLPSDRSFEDYDQALAHVAEPYEKGLAIYFDQGFLDAHLVYPIRSPKSIFTIQTTIAPDLKDLLKLTVRYLPLDGSPRAFMITSLNGQVPLDPTWLQASKGFVILGVAHILSGIDHLLFLLCLIIPFRKIRGLIPVITAFTLGHSVTLLGSAFNLAPSGSWFPPFVETAIAASILYMALENIVGANLHRRWIIAGLFGLVHGFGFSYALKDQLQFAGSHLLVSLFSFNIGIELGQLAVLSVAVPALAFLFRGALAGRTGVVLLSAIVAHTAWHWMIDRWNVLWQAPWPQLTEEGLIVFARWVAALLLTIGAARLIASWIDRKHPFRWPRSPSPEVAQSLQAEPLQKV
jgi:hydrogenase/urease accessory protein HupE